MTREFYIAFLISAAFHGSMLGICPPLRLHSQGQNGDKQEIVVLGIVQLNAPNTIEQEVPEQPPPTPEAVDVDLPESPEPDALCLRDDHHIEREVAMLPEKEGPEVEVPTKGQEGDPGEQQLSQGHIQDIRVQYLAKVLEKLERAKRYPPGAYRRGIQGTARIEFTILPNGTAAKVTLDKSSRHHVLDQAARDIVLRASPFDPVPQELIPVGIIIVVPIGFRIE